MWNIKENNKRKQKVWGVAGSPPRCRRPFFPKNGSRYTGVSLLHSHRSRYTVPLSFLFRVLIVDDVSRSSRTICDRFIFFTCIFSRLTCFVQPLDQDTPIGTSLKVSSCGAFSFSTLARGLIFLWLLERCLPVICWFAVFYYFLLHCCPVLLSATLCLQLEASYLQLSLFTHDCFGELVCLQTYSYFWELFCLQLDFLLTIEALLLAVESASDKHLNRL